MKKKIMWAVAAILILLIVVAIATPNLLKSRIAAKRASFIGRSHLSAADEAQEEDKTKTQLGIATPPNRKLIYNAELALIVGDVNRAAESIRGFVESNQGEVEELEVFGSGSSSSSATLLVRVPSSRLSSILPELKKLGIRTEREQIKSRDVTREFFDNEAHMRNLRAEEEQYRQIMKQAHTVKDTLEVSGKLSDVRDRIERLNAQILLMTRAIEMSEVKIAMMQESEASVFGWQWRPLNNAKIAASELLEGFTEWVDWVVAVLIKLPLIIVWVLTVGGSMLIVWKVGRLAWRRFMKAT